MSDQKILGRYCPCLYHHLTCEKAANEKLVAWVLPANTRRPIWFRLLICDPVASCLANVYLYRSKWLWQPYTNPSTLKLHFHALPHLSFRDPEKILTFDEKRPPPRDLSLHRVCSCVTNLRYVRMRQQLGHGLRARLIQIHSNISIGILPTLKKILAQPQ